MSTKVRIGHASTSKASTAAAEVLIGTYSASLKPTVVLRPLTAEIAERSARACEAGCNNDHIEYSQLQRRTLYEAAKRLDYDLTRIDATCYADCSSFMTVCALAAGADLNFSYMPTCGDMRKVFTASGAYKALTAEKYLTSSDYLQRGDILVRENYLNGSRHTVMVLDNGKLVPTNSTVSVLLTDVNIIKINISISSISTNSMKAKAQIISIKNGIESTLDNIGTYKWLYKLTPIDSVGKTISAEKLKISDSNTEFTLNGLKASSTYCLNVIATTNDGSTSFISPNVIFTTADKATTKGGVASLGKTTSALAMIPSIYIKINNIFKRAIIHNGELTVNNNDNFSLRTAGNKLLVDANGEPLFGKDY